MPPAAPVFTSPETDGLHRALLRTRSGDDPLELVTALVDSMLGSPRPPPATPAVRRRVVDGARELLAERPVRASKSSRASSPSRPNT